jgi:hypothetical protein
MMTNTRVPKTIATKKYIFIFYRDIKLLSFIDLSPTWADMTAPN